MLLKVSKHEVFVCFSCLPTSLLWYWQRQPVFWNALPAKELKLCVGLSLSVRFWPAIDSALRAAACTRRVQVRLLVSCWAHSPGAMFTFLQSLLVLNRPPLNCDIDVVRWETLFPDTVLATAWRCILNSLLFLILCRKSSKCLQRGSRWRFPLHESIMPSSWSQTEWSI